jgi:hypothetical protein
MTDHNSAQLHWFGMPDFQQEKQVPHAMVNIRFPDAAALEEFCRLTGMRLTEKTKSAWYPEREAKDTGMKRWK